MAKAHKFLATLWNHCKTEKRMLALAENAEPGRSIFSAMEVACDADRYTWYLQARILARQPIEEICRANGMTHEAVKWFGDLFFDVADRLDSPTYILSHAIGPQVYDLQFDDERSYLLLMGFIGGPKVVDAVLHPMGGALSDPEVVEFFRHDFRILVHLRAAVAARTLTARESKDVAKFLRSWRRFEEHDARLRNDANDGDIQRNVDEFFAAIEHVYRPEAADVYRALFEHNRDVLEQASPATESLDPLVAI